MEKVAGGLSGELHKEELHNFYYSPDINTILRSRRLRWAVRGGSCGMHEKYEKHDWFFISNFRRVLDIVFFVLGDSPIVWILYADVSEHSVFHRRCKQEFFLLTPPMKMKQTVCFETSAYKIQKLGNHTKERIQQIFPVGKTVWNITLQKLGLAERLSLK
jgi:hypothetical protein